MANLITDASFEFQNPAWVRTAQATFETPGDAYDGTTVMRSFDQSQLFPPIAVSTRWGQQFEVPVGTESTERIVRVRVRKVTTTGGLTNTASRFRIVPTYRDPSIGYGGGNVGELLIPLADLTTDWVEFNFTTTPTNTECTLLVDVDYSGAGTPTYSATLEFDAFTMLTAAEESDMVKRRAIKEAFVAALATITTANGFTHDIAESVDGIRPQRLLDAHPTLMTVYGEEVKEGAELHRRRGHLDLMTYVVSKETSSLSAEQVCDEVVGDIQIKTELQSNGQWLGLGYIDNIVMTRIEPIELAEEVHRGTRIWECTTRVTYRHTIGSP